MTAARCILLMHATMPDASTQTADRPDGSWYLNSRVATETTRRTAVNPVETRTYRNDSNDSFAIFLDDGSILQFHVSFSEQTCHLSLSRGHSVDIRDDTERNYGISTLTVHCCLVRADTHGCAPCASALRSFLGALAWEHWSGS